MPHPQPGQHHQLPPAARSPAPPPPVARRLEFDGSVMDHFSPCTPAAPGTAVPTGEVDTNLGLNMQVTQAMHNNFCRFMHISDARLSTWSSFPGADTGFVTGDEWWNRVRQSSTASGWVAKCMRAINANDFVLTHVAYASLPMELNRCKEEFDATVSAGTRTADTHNLQKNQVMRRFAAVVTPDFTMDGATLPVTTAPGAPRTEAPLGALSAAAPDSVGGASGSGLQETAPPLG